MYNKVIAAISSSLIFLLFASEVAAQTFTFLSNTVVRSCRGCNETITIPLKNGSHNIDAIGASAFKDMTPSLTSVTFHIGITAIGEQAFKDNELDSVALPRDTKSIGRYAFEGNDIESVTIPATVSYLGEGAFKGNKLTEVIFEGQRPIILGNKPFENNPSLKNIYYKKGTRGWPGSPIGGIQPKLYTPPPKPITPREATSVPTLPVALLIALPLFIASIVFKKRKQLNL